VPDRLRRRCGAVALAGIGAFFAILGAVVAAGVAVSFAVAWLLVSRTRLGRIL
jgi:hypothetical protein